MIRLLFDFLGMLFFFFIQGVIETLKITIVLTVGTLIIAGIGWVIFHFKLEEILLYSFLSVILFFLLVLLGMESWFKTK